MLHMPSLKPNPTLADLQRYVTQMEQERGFDSNTVQQKCLMLGEEVGELMKAIRKSHGGMRYATKGYEADAAGEIADILLIMLAIANRLGVDVETALREKEEVNKKRAWN